jgi:ferredoxin
VIEDVAVDPAGCIGAGQCALYAPEVFDVHDGVAHVLDATPGAHLHDAVLDAADACPVQAVLLRLRTPPT